MTELIPFPVSKTLCDVVMSLWATRCPVSPTQTEQLSPFSYACGTTSSRAETMSDIIYPFDPYDPRKTFKCFTAHAPAETIIRPFTTVTQAHCGSFSIAVKAACFLNRYVGVPPRGACRARRETLI